MRDSPTPLLAQQSMGPMVLHMLVRPALTAAAVIDVPDMDTTCEAFTANFVRAVVAD